HGEQCGGEVKLGQGLKQMPDLLVKMLSGNLGQTKEIAPLANPDDDGNTGGEADDDRIGDEFDDAAHAGQAEQQQHHTRHQGGDLQAFDAVLGGDGGKYDDEGAGRTGDL